MPRRGPDTVRGRSLALRLSLAALASAGLLALTSPDEPDGTGAQALSVMLADGTLAHDNSREGSAILSAGSVWPGWSGDGDVTITNSGSAGSWLRLTEASVDDAPGPAGGRLSERMTLLVEDATVAGFPVPVYSGTLGAVGQRWLGRMEPGEARTYRFRTVMPAGEGDNEYQASAVTVRFDWDVSSVAPGGSDPLPADPPPIDPPPAGPLPVDPPPADPPPADPPPADPPPASEPPREDIVVVPDGPPVVVVNRARLGVKLAIPTSQRPLRRRKLIALASCSRRCRATLRGRMATVSTRARGGRIARVSRSLSAGIQKRVKLRLTRKAYRKTRRRLARGRVVRGHVRIVARDRNGRVARAKQRIRLVPVRRR